MISGENLVPRRRSTQRQVFQEYTRLVLLRILSQSPKSQDHYTLMFVLAQFNENILLQKGWIWIFSVVFESQISNPTSPQKSVYD